MQFKSTLYVLAAAFIVGSNALNIPREAAPEPQGCTGQSYRDPDQATAVAHCDANCQYPCLAPFENGGTEIIFADLKKEKGFV
ncbi:MAG: hypothetical protein Q9196_000669 [Gyalolechia fulgens]